jgi:hypothetical protein
MRTSLLILAALALDARAQPAAPDDRYAKQLAGVAFVEGQGFPGVVELGTATPQMYKTLGPGREALGMPFWYFYDRGTWNLVVVAEMTASADFTTRAIEISGVHAPATKLGLHVGDSVARVKQLYGAGEAFTSTVGSPKLVTDTIADLEATYKAGIYYPKLSTLVVIKRGVVDKIVVVTGSSPARRRTPRSS